MVTLGPAPQAVKDESTPRVAAKSRQTLAGAARHGRPPAIQFSAMEDLHLVKIPVGAFAIVGFLMLVFWITG